MKTKHIIFPILIGLSAGVVGYLTTALFSGVDGTLYMNSNNKMIYAYLNKDVDSYRPGTKIVLRYKVPDITDRPYQPR